MPIEIRELVIKATVSDDKGKGKKKEKDDAEREEIVAACVEKVTEILKYEKER